MSGYIISRNAEQHLATIWDYIARDNVDAADQLIDELFSAFETLAINPALGHTRQDLTKFRVLFWPVGNYLVIYRTAKRCIEVVAVVHGNRDVPAFLRR